MINIYKNSVNLNDYIIVTYYLKAIVGKTLNDCAWNIAIGQSVGNPNVRSVWETDELFENHCCMILDEKEKLESTIDGEVKIAFPISNINIKEDGITQLLVQIMGGQLDIDLIDTCHVLDIEFPSHVEDQFMKPKYGIKGIREFTKSYDKPLLGGIVKPKVGIDPQTLLAVVKELVEGGVNFIKEDEIMSNPNHCPIEIRVPLIMDYLKDKNVIYAVCISADSPYLYERVQQVYDLGGNAVHVNFWSGLGCYKAIREMDLPLFLFF
jgi:ribulose-bisphosphate carboxylase large chain